jgi:uncharacterized protein YjbI with pentapeptide repeats
MADKGHLSTICQGVSAWNAWRAEHPEVTPDLMDADLRETDLRGADLVGVNLEGANLSGANLTEVNLDWSHLYEAELSKANLTNALIRQADLMHAVLRGAKLVGADLWSSDGERADFSTSDLKGARLDSANLHEADFAEADLRQATLRRANLIAARFDRCDLRGADLSRAVLVEASLERADISYSVVYGASIWNTNVRGATQKSLTITRSDESRITVDDIEIAQFIYLLLNNEKVRQIIDAVTSKVVLILGRFTEERKAVLDAVREELRRRDFTPVLFDFDKPASKDVTGTVETLARMARFIIADLTDPSSIPHELATIVPFLRTTPVLPIRLVGSSGYSMFEDLRRSYTWVLDIYEYVDAESLLSTLPNVIAPADEMAERLRKAP